MGSTEEAWPGDRGNGEELVCPKDSCMNDEVVQLLGGSREKDMALVLLATSTSTAHVQGSLNLLDFY